MWSKWEYRRLNEELNIEDVDYIVINKEVVNEIIEVLNVKKFEKYYKFNGWNIIKG